VKEEKRMCATGWLAKPLRQCMQAGNGYNRIRDWHLHSISSIMNVERVVACLLKTCKLLQPRFG
jgi:hypothetical protein